MLAGLEFRLDVSLSESESLEIMLTRFKARLAPLSGRIDVEAASEILEAAAEDIELLASHKSAKTSKRRSHA